MIVINKWHYFCIHMHKNIVGLYAHLFPTWYFQYFLTWSCPFVPFIVIKFVVWHLLDSRSRSQQNLTSNKQHYNCLSWFWLFLFLVASVEIHSTISLRFRKASMFLIIIFSMCLSSNQFWTPGSALWPVPAVFLASCFCDLPLSSF